MIKDDCYWYSWGGNWDKGFPSYPREYGARCNCPKIREFFYSRDGENVCPDCDGCLHYKNDIAAEIK